MDYMDSQNTGGKTWNPRKLNGDIQLRPGHGYQFIHLWYILYFVLFFFFYLSSIFVDWRSFSSDLADIKHAFCNFVTGKGVCQTCISIFYDLFLNMQIHRCAHAHTLLWLSSEMEYLVYNQGCIFFKEICLAIAPVWFRVCAVRFQRLISGKMHNKKDKFRFKINGGSVLWPGSQNYW